jgi:uncharacterized protein (DUF983 family)
MTLYVLDALALLRGSSVGLEIHCPTCGKPYDSALNAACPLCAAAEDATEVVDAESLATAPGLLDDDASPPGMHPAITPKLRRKLAVIAAGRKLEEHTRGKPGLHSLLCCCPVCGEDVSAKALSCPSCGHPINQLNRVAIITIVVLIVANLWVGGLFVFGRLLGSW